MKLTSSVCQMVKSDGPTNAGAGMWVDDDLDGDYYPTCAPEDWRDVLRAAASNTHGMGDGDIVDLCDLDDWTWWRRDEERDGLPTGIEWLVAQWADDSSAVTCK